MKTDIQGCSTTAAGTEQHEEFFSSISHGVRVQYDYRTPEGKLFSCIAKSLEEARARRDTWIEKQKAQ